MTLFKEKALLIGRVPQKYEFFNLLYVLGQLPADESQGRFILPCEAKGYGNGLPSTYAHGIAVFDFDNDANQWRLTNFKAYSSSLARGACMVNGTELIRANDKQSSDAVLQRSSITIDAAPLSGVTINYTSQDVASPAMPFNYIAFISAPSAGYNGELIFGYYRDKAINGYGTTNGFIDKLSLTTYTPMSGAVNTGFTGAEGYQGQPCLAIAMLGGPSPNGYVVTDAERDDGSTAVRYALVNCTGTPALVANVTWAGADMAGIVSLSATKTVASYNSAASTGALALMYTNSATAPTSLTQGATTALPDPPAGYGFDAADVEMDKCLCDQLGSNLRVGEDKALITILWKLLSTSTLADGDTAYYVVAPVIVTSSSTANLVASIPTEDIHGLPTKLQTYTTANPFDNYQTQTVGCGNDKATWLFRDYNTDKLIQQTFQL